MKRVTTIAFTYIFLLIGCGGTKAPAPTQASKIDYGKKPRNITVSKARKAFHDFKDPMSIRIEILSSVPKKAYVINPVGGEVAMAGWVVTVEANAKNSYGAYTGRKMYRVLFINDSVIGTFGVGSTILKVVGE